MKEKNREMLRGALSRLPQYAPPAGLWAGVRRQLEPGLADRLPSYQPPPEVWNELSAHLQMQQEGDGAQVRALAGKEQQSPRSRSLRRYRPLRWVAVAAGFLLLLTAAYQLLADEAGPTVSYAYQREAAPTATARDWEDDESSFTAVLNELEHRNEPELNTLRMELDELTEASQEVKAMLVAYGDDPQVVRQLAAIERDRSDVYRRIIVRL